MSDFITIQNLIVETKGLNILYVEDEDEIREFVSKQLLEPLFKTTHSARNGQEGLELFKTCNCDLIMTDIKMPILNGLEMTREIRNVNKNIPIIVLSAYDIKDYFLDSIELGVNHYLLKPIEKEKLFKALFDISTNLNNKRRIDEIEHKEELRRLEIIEEQKNKIHDQESMLIKQSKMAIMGEMMSIITHQWNQPLNIISMTASNMQNDLEDATNIDKDLQNELLKGADSIIHTVVFMSETMRKFKNYFKSNKLKFSIKVAQEIEDILSMVEPQLNSLKITIKVDIDENLKIKAPQNELKQVALNLISNSKDAIKENKIPKGTITISSKECDDSVVLIFEDNGGGIPEELIDVVFQSNISTKGENGTGIGLYMSKMIIEESIGGKIVAKNGKNGAIFELTIPKG